MRTSISLLLSFVSCAAAWGYDGHAAVGLVADAFLTEAARAQVSQRLATSMNFTSLREPALMNWADKVLYDKRWVLFPPPYTNIDIREPILGASGSTLSTPKTAQTREIVPTLRQGILEKFKIWFAPSQTTLCGFPHPAKQSAVKI